VAGVLTVSSEPAPRRSSGNDHQKPSADRDDLAGSADIEGPVRRRAVPRMGADVAVQQERRLLSRGDAEIEANAVARTIKPIPTGFNTGCAASSTPDSRIVHERKRRAAVRGIVGRSCQSTRERSNRSPRTTK
jgi:hypothetical protein